MFKPLLLTAVQGLYTLAFLPVNVGNPDVGNCLGWGESQSLPRSRANYWYDLAN